MRRTLIRARQRLRRELAERPFALPSSERASGLVDSVATEAGLEAGDYTVVQAAERVVRRPPRTVHDEVHPVFHLLRESDQPEVFNAVLRGGRVVGPDPLIVTRDLRVLVRSHYHPSEIQKSRVVTHRLPRPTKVAGAAIALVTPWYYNHYHWLVDHLGRVALLDDEPELPVVVPPRPSRVQIDSLELAGIDRARLRPLQHPHLQVEELHWPSLLGETGHPPPWAMQRLRERLVPGGSASSDGRLYVARRPTDERRVRNDRQLCAFLRERGFDVVEPAGMSFAEQRAAFATAGVIVGPHGAGLANMIMSYDATVVELVSPAYVNGSCYTLADALGHEYWYVLGEPSRARDFRVDLALLEATLDEALREPGRKARER
jgi:capsular polysaccharide biosynthesis protein